MFNFVKLVNTVNSLRFTTVINALTINTGLRSSIFLQASCI